MGVVVKSSRLPRLAENFQVFDFTLTPQELQAVAQLEEGQSLFGWYP